jgi:hypothetical protein
MVTDHNHAPISAQKISPTRADEGSDKQKMRRDEKVRAIEKGGRASNPENHHFLG